MVAHLASLLLGAVNASAWLPTLLDATLKGTLLLAAAALLTAVLRRSSAALRHFVWSVAVTSVVLLPILSRVLPSWNAPLVPAIDLAPAATAIADGRRAEAPAVTVARATASPELGASVGARAAEPLATPSPIVSSATTPVVTPSLASTSAPSGADASAAPSAPSAPSAPAPLASPRSADAHVDWVRVVMLVWLAGAVVVLVRLALGTLAVWRIARRSTRVTDPAWLALAQRTAKELGVLRPVTLLVGRRHSVPLTWGIVYPVVLLPADAGEWSEERRRLVLVHEMSHVDRLDAFTQLVAQVGLALFWFNPLLWIAVARMRAERERACDDRVIAAGTRASLYADDLLTIVRTMHQRTGPAFAALAMARRSEFEGRLLAILDPSVPRQGVGRRGALAVASTALALVLPLSALRPWRAEAAAAPPAQSVSVRREEPLPAGPAGPAGPAVERPLPPSPAATDLAPINSALGDPKVVTTALGTAAPTVARAVVSSAPAQCRRSVYSGPGYNFTVRSGRQTSMHVVNDDDGRRVATMLVVDDTLCLFMDMTGKVTFNEDETDFATISPDGHVTIERAREGREERLEITRDDRGALVRRYTENGREADPASARAMLAELIPTVAREMALDPNGRVARIRRKSGIGGVLRDIALTRSDGAKRAFYDALVTSGNIPADTLQLMAQLVSRSISSDGDKAYVLGRIDEQRNATPAVHVAVADAARTISSDGDKRRVLQGAIGRSGGAVPAYSVANIAGSISSDGDKSAVLGQVAERYDGSDTLRAAFFKAANTISSDGDRSRVLLALIRRNDPLDKATQIALLRSARQISSDHDKASVLIPFVDDGGDLGDDTVRSAFFDAVNTISSDYDRSRVLLAAVRRTPQPAALTRDLLTSTSRMTSDHSKGTVLTAVARATSLTEPTLRAQFISVLKTLTSDNEYRKVMDELMK